LYRKKDRVNIVSELSKREQTRYIKKETHADPFHEKITMEGLTGAVRFYDHDKGYGFLRTGNTVDIFFHVTKLPPGMETIEEGLIFNFDVATTRKGMQAVNMKIAEQ